MQWAPAGYTAEHVPRSAGRAEVVVRTIGTRRGKASGDASSGDAASMKGGSTSASNVKSSPVQSTSRSCPVRTPMTPGSSTGASQLGTCRGSRRSASTCGRRSKRPDGNAPTAEAGSLSITMPAWNAVSRCSLNRIPFHRKASKGRPWPARQVDEDSSPAGPLIVCTK